jgi:hypothetical protein
MNIDLLLDNLTNPALLFFLLGIIATRLKSDLEIPPNSSKFISLYLLFSIGFKGGQELAHSHFDLEIIYSAIFGVFIALIIPIYCFFILKRRFSIENSGAIAAAYGSVSAVTFVTAISFLEIQKYSFSGHMVAIMALMEAPAIIIGVILMKMFNKNDVIKTKMKSVVKHSLTNGSVLLILGSLLIGFLASDQQAMGIKPFTTDIFKGFLAIFLLDMGIVSGKKLNIFFKSGWSPVVFAILIPLLNGSVVALLSQFVTNEIGNRFILILDFSVFYFQ